MEKKRRFLAASCMFFAVLDEIGVLDDKETIEP
jgi:hypothetical protein